MPRRLVAMIVANLCLATPLAAMATIRPLLKAGDPFPGGTVTAIYFSAVSPSGRKVAASIGAAIPSRPGASTALVTWENGVVKTLALEGDALPGGVLYGGSNMLFMNGAGEIAFSKQNRVYRWDATGVHLDVSVGDLPPGRAWIGVSLADFNHAGDLLLRAADQPVPGGPVGAAMLVRTGGVVTELFHTGAHSVEGDLIDRFQGAVFNTAREVVFTVGLDAAYRADGGVIRRILRPGDPAPGGGTIDGIDQVAIDEGGALALVANFGQTLATGGHAAQLIHVDGSGMGAFVVAGATTPWGGTFTAFSAFPAFNRVGDLVFGGAFTGAPGRAVVLRRADGTLVRLFDEYTPAPWDPAHRLFGVAYPEISDDRRMTLSTFIEGQPDGPPTVLLQVTADYDGDGVDDPDDPCTDTDGDGFGDPGFPANTCVPDACPSVADPGQSDGDRDGVGDACDVCPEAFDPAQADRDADGTGDACDACTDEDGDGFGLAGNACPLDVCPAVADPEQTDTDGDGVGDRCDDCPIFPDPLQDRPDACVPAPLPKLTVEQLAAFQTGLQAFAEQQAPADGLGPIFNGVSCAECHNRPVLGGSSNRFTTRFGATTESGFDPLAALGGSVLQSRGIATAQCAVAGETVPPEATIVARRDPLALFGAGLIDAISDDRIARKADPLDRNGDGISGRPAFVGVRIGRFGWKAQVARLEDFVAGTMAADLGLTNPARPVEEKPQGKAVVCDAVADPEDDGTAVRRVTDFLRLLAPPPPVPFTPLARYGKRLFKQLRCNGCHTDKLRTGPNPNLALKSKRVRLYSDLLLHDMGKLGDGVVEGAATASEFRTPPLWGLRDGAPYLHDGRAPTIEAAIAAHDGEAGGSRDRFLQLGPSGTQALIEFLRSL